jgi:hypothetical protein
MLFILVHLSHLLNVIACVSNIYLFSSVYLILEPRRPHNGGPAVFQPPL